MYQQQTLAIYHIGIRCSSSKHNNEIFKTFKAVIGEKFSEIKKM